MQDLIAEKLQIEEDIKKERIKLRTTALELNRQQRQEARFELLYENIKDCITMLDVPEFKVVQTVDSNNKIDYLVCLADIHFGAKFKTLHNEYSIEIFYERLNTLLNELKNLIEKEKILKLTILSLGDDLQGILRVNDLIMNQTPITEAVVLYSKAMSKFLNELSAYCEIDYYCVSNSNHTQIRPLGTKANELATEDLEKIIINYIHDSLENNERITVHNEFEVLEDVIFEIHGFKIIAKHGHKMNSTLENVLKDLSNFHRIFFDYGIFGHLHGGKETVVGTNGNINSDVIVADSFQGSCPYADSLMKSAKGAVKILKFTDNGYVGYDKIIFNK